MALFTADELSDFVQYAVSPASAAIAERVVDGWLKSATEVDTWPDPLPAEVFAWALELGAIAHENPTALAARTVDGETDQYLIGRRSEIHAAAAAWRGSAATRATGPSGSFPAPAGWPDPAGTRWTGRY